MLTSQLAISTYLNLYIYVYIGTKKEALEYQNGMLDEQEQPPQEQPPQEQTLQEKPKRKRKRKLLKPDIKEEALEYQNIEQPPQEKHEKKRKRKLLTDTQILPKAKRKNKPTGKENTAAKKSKS